MSDEGHVNPLATDHDDISIDMSTEKGTKKPSITAVRPVEHDEEHEEVIMNLINFINFLFFSPNKQRLAFI